MPLEHTVRVLKKGRAVAIYIPSRQRAEQLQRVLPSWRDTDLPIYLTLETEDVPDYYRELGKLGYPKRLEILELPESDRGYGYACRFNIEHAVEQGEKAMVIADDDIGLAPNLSLLETFVVEHPQVPGIGSHFNLHLRHTNRYSRTGAVMATGASIRQCVCIRPEDAITFDWFGPMLDMLDDTGMLVSGIQEFKHPWMLHTEVISTYEGDRWAPGGVASVPRDRQEMELQAYDLLCRLHGSEYFQLSKNTAKNGNPRHVKVLWKKLFQDFVPDIPYHDILSYAPSPKIG
jgi:hypothetical protein